jgi:anti-sigma factor RsiW
MADLNDKEREDLVAYLDGELAETEASALEAKLHRNAAVKKEADSLQKAWDLLDYLPKAEPTSSFTNRTMERITSQGMAPVAKKPNRLPARPWLSGLGWAAAMLLSAGAGFGLFTYFFSPRAPQTERADDQKQRTDPLEELSPEDIQHQLARNLRILENKRLYELVDDLEMLQELGKADLFGDEE